MDIKEFAEEVKNRMSEKRENLIPETVDVVKNNGVTYHGITIRVKGDNNCVAPTMYVDRYYHENMSVEETAESILKGYESNKEAQQNFTIDKDEFLKGDYIRNNVFVRLMNYEKNKDTIKNNPYIRMGDLVVTLRVNVQSKGMEETASFLLNNSTMEYIGAKTNEMFEIAKENYKKMFPPKLEPIANILMRRTPWLSEEEKKALQDECNMHILTSEQFVNGAYYMTDKEVLAESAKKLGTDKIIILPSSIHEVIILPDNFAEASDEELLELVKSVNINEVSPEEVLSDNVYVFDSKTNEVRSISGELIV